MISGLNHFTMFPDFTKSTITNNGVTFDIGEHAEYLDKCASNHKPIIIDIQSDIFSAVLLCNLAYDLIGNVSYTSIALDASGKFKELRIYRKDGSWKMDVNNNL